MPILKLSVHYIGEINYGFIEFLSVFNGFICAALFLFDITNYKVGFDGIFWYKSEKFKLFYGYFSDNN